MLMPLACCALLSGMASGASALARISSTFSAGPIPVEIRKTSSGYQLYRGGQPYTVRGAGTQLVDDLELLQATGGNSIRTWSTDVGDLLDVAASLDITVTLCLDMKPERRGFDYDDEQAVRRQHERIRGEVLKYRDHPALLAWMLGNELNLFYTNPRVYDAVNDAARMIHELDPNHPVTTATAGMDESLWQVISSRAPELDFLSIQLYGGIMGLAKTLARINLTAPVMVTEWGTVGHWEVNKTPWGAPVEIDSTQKAAHFQKAYQDVIARLPHQIIGNYVFLWAYKQERTPTWYGMLAPGGIRTEAVDVMQKIWTGKWPANRVPMIAGMTLAGKRAGADIALQTGSIHEARVTVSDMEDDPLDYRWALLRESTATQVGGDAEATPEDVSQYIVKTASNVAQIRVPEAGTFRIFIYVNDAGSGLAHANVPFRVMASTP